MLNPTSIVTLGTIKHLKFMVIVNLSIVKYFVILMTIIIQDLIGKHHQVDYLNWHVIMNSPKTTITYFNSGDII